MAKRRKLGDPHAAIAYMRASTDGQGLSAAAQGAAIDAWAAQSGVTVLFAAIDQGVSGASPLAERPSLQAALTLLRERGAGVLVVAKRDRLARDVIVADAIDREVIAHGAVLISADGVGNGSGPTDKFMRTVFDGFSAYERELIKARTKAALAAKKARGERTGGVPYGYELRADDAHRVVRGVGGAVVRVCAPKCKGCLYLEICHREQEVIELARQLVASGLTYRRVVRVLAERGHFNRKGKIFDLGQIWRFLRTPDPVGVAPPPSPTPASPPTAAPTSAPTSPEAPAEALRTARRAPEQAPPPPTPIHAPEPLPPQEDRVLDALRRLGGSR